MPELIGKPLSAVTANVLFDGMKIGELQEITVEEDFNIKPIEQIGSGYIVEFLPGTSVGRIVAKRALLESDLFFDRLTPGMKASTALTDITKDISNGTIDISPSVKAAEGLSDFWQAVFSGKAPRDKLQFVVYFDVELLDADNVVFAKFSNCVLKARTLSITLGAVIVMQDITALFQARTI